MDALQKELAALQHEQRALVALAATALRQDNNGVVGGTANIYIPQQTVSLHVPTTRRLSWGSGSSKPASAIVKDDNMIATQGAPTEVVVKVSGNVPSSKPASESRHDMQLRPPSPMHNRKHASSKGSQQTMLPGSNSLGHRPSTVSSDSKHSSHRSLAHSRSASLKATHASQPIEMTSTSSVTQTEIHGSVSACGTSGAMDAEHSMRNPSGSIPALSKEIANETETVHTVSTQCEVLERQEQPDVHAQAVYEPGHQPSIPQPPDTTTTRQAVIREMLALLLDAPDSLLDSYRLDMQTLQQVIEHKIQQAASQAQQRESRLVGKRIQQAVEAAECDWKILAQKELTNIQEQAATVQQDLQSQLTKAQREVASLVSEKRSLMAKAGQQSRECKEAKDALQAAKLNIADLTKQVAHVKAVAAAADKSRMEAERTAVHARQAAVAAQADAQARIQAASEAAERSSAAACSSAQKQAVAAPQMMETMKAAENERMQVIMQELHSISTDIQQSYSLALADLQESMLELSSVKGAAADLLQQLGTAGREAQEGMFETVGQVHEACCSAVGSVQVRVQQVVEMDKRLSSLGLQGLEAICQELQQAKAALAAAQEQVVILGSRLAASESSRDAAMVQKCALQEELSALSHCKASLQGELTSLRQEQARLTGLVSDWKARHADATMETASTASQLQASITQLNSISKELETAQQQVAREQEASDSLRNQVATLKQQLQVQMHLNRTSESRLQRADAVQVSQLRKKYFVPIGPSFPHDTAGICKDHNSHDRSSQQSSLYAHTMQTPCKPALTDVNRHDSAPVATSQIEELVGLGLCQLSHEQIMDAMNAYLDKQQRCGKQALLRLSQPQLAADAADVSDTGSATCRDEKQADSPAATGPEIEDVVARELLWLEGCLLLLLVQVRQLERQTTSTKQEQVDQPDIASHGPPASHATKSLVAQMLKSMTVQNRRLQQQVCNLSAQAAGRESPLRRSSASFMSYLPLRRSLSARTSRTPTRPGSSSSCSHDSAINEIHSKTRGRLNTIQDTTSSAALNDGDATRADDQSDNVCSELITTHYANLDDQAAVCQDEELLHVLNVLDASELRRSRGFDGISTSLHTRTFAKPGVEKNAQLRRLYSDHKHRSKLHKR